MGVQLCLLQYCRHQLWLRLVGSILKILETHCGIQEMELLLILDDFWKRFCNGVFGLGVEGCIGVL